VLGGIDDWREGLAAAGVEVVDPGGARPPDLAVAPPEQAAQAAATGAAAVVVEGRAGRALGARGLALTPLLVRPTREEPVLVLAPEHRRASAAAIAGLAAADRPWKLVRAEVARRLALHGALPRPPAAAAPAAARAPGPPALVGAAGELGVPAGAEWSLALGTGDVLSRNVFHLLPPGENDPAWVVKFARTPGYADPFDRDERGLGLAAAAGGAVAARAPALVGRFELEGLAASVETAAAGRRLRETLLLPGGRERKLSAVDAVASWALAAARATAAPPEALEAERGRLGAEVLPHWLDAGAPPELVDALPPLPGVLQHNDLGTWNVIARGPEFTVVDWESAREHGLPLWDLLYFLADALALLDGAADGEQRHLHTLRLFRGELPSSRHLFAWVRRAVEELALPPEAVGPVATLCWLHHSRSHLARGDALAAAGATGAASLHGTELVGGAWLADPALGPSWRAWQRSAP
jgi:hypothetical protein